MNAFFILLLGILLCENPGKQSYRLQQQGAGNQGEGTDSGRVRG